MKRSTALVSALLFVFALVEPALGGHSQGHGDAVGPVQWVGCADIHTVELSEVTGVTTDDENDPPEYADPLQQIPTDGPGQKTQITGIKLDILVYRGSCLSQDRLGTPQHAVTFDSVLYRKDVSGPEPVFTATTRAPDAREVEHLSSGEDMLRLTLTYNFDDSERYWREAEGDGEGTQSDFYYCVQASSLIHRKPADWAPNLTEGGSFNTTEPLCTDAADPGSRTFG